MKERSADEAAPIYFGEKLASSQAFAALFRDGMALVEETAAYLDGPGRQESKKLNDQVRRLDANIYAPPLAPDKPRVKNPVERQMGLLKAAFEQDGH